MTKKGVLAFILAIVVGISLSIVFIPDSIAACKHTYKTTYGRYCVKQHKEIKTCTKCKHKVTTLKSHSYNLYMYKKDSYGGQYHTCCYNCTKCGQSKTTREKHTYKNGKCTKCGQKKAKG